MRDQFVSSPRAIIEAAIVVGLDSRFVVNEATENLGRSNKGDRTRENRVFGVVFASMFPRFARNAIDVHDRKKELYLLFFFFFFLSLFKSRVPYLPGRTIFLPAYDRLALRSFLFRV